MSNFKERQKPTEKVKGMHKAADLAFNEQAGAFKFLGGIMGDLLRMFVFDVAAKDLPEPFKNGGLVAFYNDGAVTAWLTTGDNTAAAPAASSANGIALKPNDYTILAMPDGTTNVNCNVSTVVAYLVQDDTYYR